MEARERAAVENMVMVMEFYDMMVMCGCGGEWCARYLSEKDPFDLRAYVFKWAEYRPEKGTLEQARACLGGFIFTLSSLSSFLASHFPLTSHFPHFDHDELTGQLTLAVGRRTDK